MADLAPVVANVAQGTGAIATMGTAGVALIAGDTIYLDSVTSTLKLGDCDALASAAVIGIALHAAGIGQPVRYQTEGEIALGTTLVVGEIYVQSVTAGKICLLSDIGVGDFTTIIGIGKTAALMTLILRAGGVAHG